MIQNHMEIMEHMNIFQIIIKFIIYKVMRKIIDFSKNHFENNKILLALENIVI